MKTIVINALSANIGGGQTNLKNVLRFAPNSRGSFILIVSSANKSVFEKYRSPNVHLFESKIASLHIFMRSVWELAFLPFLLRRWQATSYYAPGGVLLTRVPKECVSITTIQNMLPFDDRARRMYPLLSVIRYKLLILRYVNLLSMIMADKVIFISDYSRNTIIERWPWLSFSFVTIPLGVSSIFYERQPDSRKDLKITDDPSENIFIYVSHLDYYKCQIEVVLEWSRAINLGVSGKLVLIGPTVNKYGVGVKETVRNLGLEERVLFFDSVEHHDLPKYYQSATALIFASSCECCPNILLEMLSSRKVIFCSSLAPMPEFARDSVIYFNPFENDSLSSAMSAYHENPAHFNFLVDRCSVLSTSYVERTNTQSLVEFLIQ